MSIDMVYAKKFPALILHNLRNLNMENFSKLWTWIKTLPTWLRAIVLLLVAVLAFIASMSFSACGTPKTVATVQNVNPNSTVTVTMSVSNSTTPSTNVDATPSVNLNR